MFFRISQAIQLFIYNYRESIVNKLNIINLLVSLCSIGILTYYFGFPFDQQEDKILFNLIRVIFTYFVFQFFARLIFSIQIWDFIKAHWFEGILAILLFVEGISELQQNDSLLNQLFYKIGFVNNTVYLFSFMKIYLLLVAGVSFLKTSFQFIKIKLKPSITLILSLGVLSLIGAGFLIMPKSTTIEGTISFKEALFTSVSAISQTGLILQDTGSFFTFKGQVVIMLLIQIGALGIISFGTFFGSYLSQGLSINQENSFQDFFFSESSEANTTNLFKNIMFYTLFIDIIGTLIIFFSWGDNIHFNSFFDKVFISLFHSVSAFCNAGFSLFPQGLYTNGVSKIYVLHIIILLLVYLGSIGYPTLFDLFDIKAHRDRINSGWKKLHLDTKISLYTSLALVFAGAIAFYFLEHSNTLSELDTKGSITASFFQSTMRTAGFNTVDISKVGIPMLLVFCFLMFIGGSSASVCGGIKTSTFAITLLALYNALRGKSKLEMGKREIPLSIMIKVMSIWVFAITFILSCIFALTISDPNIELIDSMFEVISAFGTVGLSTGITSGLSDTGHYILIIAMFVGRVGTMTVAFALSSQVSKQNHKYPPTNMFVG